MLEKFTDKDIFMDGFNGEENRHLFSSNYWLLHEAGANFYKKGTSHPVIVKKSRGYTVKVTTAGNTDFLIKFHGNKLEKATIERTN